MRRAAATAVGATDSPAVARALELGALALIVLDFGRIVVGLIALDAPLHWDEAVYAVRARSWVDPEAALSGWSYIRPPLLPMLAGIPVLPGGDEWQLRLIGLLAGIGVLLAAWWLGRMVAGPLAGVLAAAVLHGSPTLQKESATLLTDVPATALVLLAAGLVWWQLEARPRPGVALALGALVAVAAFLMRYGSVVVLVPLAGMVVLLWWRVLIANAPAALAALAIGFVAAAGHVAWSMAQTGAPLGILLGAQDVVSADPAGVPPYREYVRYVDFTLAGSVGAAAMRLGVLALPLAALAAVVRPGWDRSLRAALFLLVPAAAQVYLLTRGVAHAEERFFLVSTVLIVIAGASVAGTLLRRMPGVVTLAALGAVVVLLAFARGQSVDHSLQRTEETARYYRQFELAGRAVGLAAGDDCGIVGGGYPILAWYSGCEAAALRLPPGGNLHARERWAVLFGDPDDLDRSTPIVTAVMAAATDEPVTISDPDSGAVIASLWRLE
jgi:hypothetical protein